jgi:hypothetical protein
MRWVSSNFNKIDGPTYDMSSDIHKTLVTVHLKVQNFAPDVTSEGAKFAPMISCELHKV